MALIASGTEPEDLTANIKAQTDGICSGCHVAGVANAPKIGDKDAWARAACCHPVPDVKAITGLTLRCSWSSRWPGTFATTALVSSERSVYGNGCRVATHYPERTDDEAHECGALHEQ